MTDKIVEGGVAYRVNDQPEQLDRLAGLGLTGDLAAAEAASWRRFLPGGKLPWSEVTESERRVEELERRRQETEARRLEVATQLQSAPSRDLELLSEWERGNRRGPRPEPTRPALEAEHERLQADEQALLVAIDRTTADRAEFVEKNRSKLVKDAVQVEEQALERAQSALRELGEARSALIEARRLRLWASLYPAQEVGREPRWALLAGGLKRALEKIGLESVVAAEQVLEALSADIEWLSTAASPEQRAKLEPRRVGQEERERSRDRQLDDATRLRGQLAHDRRAGELAALKGRVR